MHVYCNVENCPNYLDLDEDTFYLCRKHTPLAPDIVRFQEYQFDTEIPRGTEYIDPEGYLE